MNAKTDINPAELRDAQAAAVDALLSHRTADGHWQGHLASSALSTAVAAFALHRARSADRAGIVTRALAWIVKHQNADGGWGDTTVSHSNLSTTILCWCALTITDDCDDAERGARLAAAERAETYIAAQCGSLEPGDVAAGVSARYGNDKSFSAPILTMAALAGRLGPAPACWRFVPQLPFEVGSLSHATLRLVRLPVVSYALPALIAIGQVRHARRPTRNPVTRLLRGLARKRTLLKLRDIQPISGGYLEAAPLTAFVLMGLAVLRGRDGAPPDRPADRAANAAEDVIARAEAFLRETHRPDGAWPIDTDLATWTTTLSINALPASALDDADRRALMNWLLRCQYARRHPYTQANPGGWAWTDLSGGVPDADDTAGAIRALRRLAPDDPRALDAAAAGCLWLADLQNADGGMPTFCRGWGKLPFDRSCHDLTAHAVLAWHDWLADLTPAIGKRIESAADRAMQFLLRDQGPAGQWTPLWFGNQDAPREANPAFGTARVLLSLSALPQSPKLAAAIARGADYLLTCRNADGSFTAWPQNTTDDPADATRNADAPAASIEETAVAVEALSVVLAAGAAAPDQAERLRDAVDAGTHWLIAATRTGRDFPAAPIGLYFARLWYFERLYPIIFTVAALTASRKALGL